MTAPRTTLRRAAPLVPLWIAAWVCAASANPFRVAPGEPAAAGGPASAPRGALEDGAWSALSPPTRASGAMVLDSVRDRLLWFGGVNGWRVGKPAALADNEVWELPLGAGGRWARLATTGDPPARRTGHAAIYDPVGDRMVIFGGRSDTTHLNDVWALSLSGTPTWSRLDPAGTPPAPRELHAACYDARHQRMLVFGGTINFSLGADFNDVWALSLSGSPSWVELTPSSGLSPAPREGPSAIDDPVRDQMVIFAGVGKPGYLQDVWALPLSGTSGWSYLAIPGLAPCPRFGHGAAYDPGGDRMIVFGGEFFSTGSCPSGFFDDVWALPLAAPAWQPITPSGAPPRGRAFAGVCIDPARSRLLIHGGSGYDQVSVLPPKLTPIFFLSDTWTLPLTGAPAWSRLASGPLPVTGRYDHVMVYDAFHDRLLAFGGDRGYGALSDVWTMSLQGTPDWSLLPTGGTPPPALADAAAVIDPATRSLLVVGGDSDGTYRNGVWRLSLDGAPTWSAVAVGGTPPSPRRGHTLVLDRRRNRALLFGGRSAPTAALADVWELTLGAAPQWKPVLPAGTPPSARYGHTAILDEARDRMLVFGGTDGASGQSADLWELSLGGVPTWNHLSPNGAVPPGRFGHTAILDLERDRMVVWGGLGSGSLGYADVWALALDSPAWSPLLPADDAPAGRTDHAATYDPVRDRMIGFGGAGYDDSWLLAWGAATAPDVVCPEDVTWQAGASLALHYAVTSRLGMPATWEWTLAGERDWPGLPIEGTLMLGAGQTDSVRASVPVPDSAAGGLDALMLSVRLAGAPALGSSCSHPLRVIALPQTPTLALRGARPNPSAGAIRAEFSLPDAREAWLVLSDIGGRRLLARSVGSLGPGTHVVPLAGSETLPPGIYWLKLSAVPGTRTARVAVVK